MRNRRGKRAAATGAVLAMGTLLAIARFGQAPPPAWLPGSVSAQGRPSPIQSAGGGKGPAAAPDANDPANAKADLSPKPPVKALAPEEQAKQFWLPAGYRIEAVLSDPLIDSPGQLTFDGNGRMFVVELRGYEQTLDGIDSLVPTGRISAHEDRDGDGTFEHHTVFVDGLLFPRFAMPFGANAILTSETNHDEIWKYTDTNADGVADRKELFTADFGRGGNIEAQPSNLFWAMDNWLYSTVNSFRMRWTPTGVIREATGPSSSQWGVTQDDEGKVWFQHGASGLPGYFQFPVHYGNFAHPDQFEPDLEIVWGAPILVGDVQAGLPGTRMPDGSLIYATAAAGNAIYRGHRLPRDLLGDYVYGETVARSVRRLRPVVTEGLTQLRNVYPRSEFIRSLDPLFRPVGIANAPDGTLYIADMYRGVIEGAPWAKEGTYLREKIRQYQLDRILGRGRVWRLSYEGMPPDRTRPRMLQERPAQLVAHLSHPNGWWRDTAQQLLVLAQDHSVVPALQKIVRGSTNRLARAHALWTLEGLGRLDPALARHVLKDPDSGLRIQAIRASESLYKAGDASFAADWRAIAEADGDTNVAIQAMLTLQHVKAPGTAEVVASIRAARTAQGIEWVAGRILNPPAAASRGVPLMPDERGAVERGATAYAESCFACHGEDGRGAPAPGGGLRGPALGGSSRVTGHRDYVIRTLLHGLTGPLDGRRYAEVMAPMGASRDAWIADVASYIRTSFGNSASIVTEADVARVRKADAGRQAMWTADELAGALPRPLIPDATWRATASHNGAAAAGALDFSRWSSGAPQEAGMWLQIELPAASMLTEIQFDSQVIPDRQGGPPTSTAPRAYRLELSEDGRSWSAPVAEGRGEGRTTAIPFPPTPAKFLRITLTGTAEGAPPWTVERLRAYESAAGAGSR
ncbi:MAG TPA: c-type cytochrome [Vicinamibacterales bacterium]|nr:c-type cytochrome [Vicinamibacterales bacterium]